MANQKDGAMNGTGIVDAGFPMWPQFAEETPDQVAALLKTGKVCYWTGPIGMEFEEKWAKSLRARTVSLFLHPTRERHYIERCINALKEVLERHTK